MDNQELQKALAEVAEALSIVQYDMATVSRTSAAIRETLRELPLDGEFEELYQKHYADPDPEDAQVRDILLGRARALGELLRRLRSE